MRLPGGCAQAQRLCLHHSEQKHWMQNYIKTGTTCASSGIMTHKNHEPEKGTELKNQIERKKDMKKMKKIVSLLLTVVMVMAMMVMNVSAATVTIEGTGSDGLLNNHTFSAYQIFKGKISNDKLIDIDWGEGINSGEFLTELKEKNLKKRTLLYLELVNQRRMLLIS